MSKENNAAGDGNEQVEEFVVIEVDEKGEVIKPVVEDNADAHASADTDIDDEPDADADDVDERVGHSEDDDADTGAVAGETAEEKRERRRRENKAKRIRNRKNAEVKDRIINQQGQALLNMEERLAKIEGRTIQYDVQGLQTRLQQVEGQQRDAKKILADLVKAGDGDGVAELTELQAQLRDQHREISQRLDHAKRQAAPAREGQPAANGGQATRPKPHPEVMRRAQEWADQNAWFGPEGDATAEERDIVKVIDKNLFAEGYNPKDPDYWTELTNRVKRRIPQRFQQKRHGKVNGDTPNNGQRQASGGPRMAAAAQGGAKALGKNEVRVTPERKKAMQDAGKWDDPKLRNRQLAAYAKYDREQAGQ